LKKPISRKIEAVNIDAQTHMNPSASSFVNFDPGHDEIDEGFGS
jgi:hypothetical protein